MNEWINEWMNEWMKKHVFVKLSSFSLLWIYSVLDWPHYDKDEMIRALGHLCAHIG